MTTTYGDPLAYAPGATVTRPDGSTFTQGDTATYRRVTCEPMEAPPRPPGGPERRVMKLTLEVPGSFLTPAALITRVHGPRLHRSGKWYETVYRVKHGPGQTSDFTLRHLRHSREGNG